MEVIFKNEEGFIDKLSKLMDVSFYQKCQDGCIGLASDYDRKKLANKILRVIGKIIKE
jgi:hypothetical protein